MANEWTKVELYGANNDGDVRRYTIADGTSVSKGQLLELTDPRTAVAMTARGQMVAGVASEEHLASVGITSISCWTNGVFLATASGSIAVGSALIAGTAGNAVSSGAISTVASGAVVLGYCLNAPADNGTAQVRLNL